MHSMTALGRLRRWYMQSNTFALWAWSTVAGFLAGLGIVASGSYPFPGNHDAVWVPAWTAFSIGLVGLVRGLLGRLGANIWLRFAGWACGYFLGLTVLVLPAAGFRVVLPLAALRGLAIIAVVLALFTTVGDLALSRDSGR